MIHDRKNCLKRLYLNFKETKYLSCKYGKCCHFPNNSKILKIKTLLGH